MSSFKFTSYTYFTRIEDTGLLPFLVFSHTTIVEVLVTNPCSSCCFVFIKLILFIEHNEKKKEEILTLLRRGKNKSQNQTTS